MAGKPKSRDNYYMYPLPLHKVDHKDIVDYLEAIDRTNKAEKVRFAIRLLMAYEKGQEYELLLVPKDRLVEDTQQERTQQNQKKIPEDIIL